MRHLILHMTASVLAVATLQGNCLAQFDLLSQTRRTDDPADQKYALTEECGPVMIKAASFVGSYTNPKGEEFADGLQLANALAKELREEYGLDAYTCRYQIGGQERTKEQQEEFDRQLEKFEDDYRVPPRVMKYKNPPPANWVVLVGHFPSFEDRGAQKTLEKIRKINPECISGEVKKLLRFGKADNDVPNPLRTAMLVPNPHPKAKEVVSHSAGQNSKLFEMLLQLNDGERFSMYQLKSPGTIQVATYRGIALVDEKKAKTFFNKDKVIEDKAILQHSAQRAILLAETLRQQGHEAFVFHGKFASIVSIGGYNDQNDPRVQADIEKFSKLTVAGVQLQPKLIATPRRPPGANTNTLKAN